MKHKLLKYFARLTARALLALTQPDTSVKHKIQWLISPIKFVGNIFFKFLFVPIYGFAYFIKRAALQLILPAKNRFMFLVANRYVVHGLIIFITTLTSITSLHAREVRAENLGEKSLLYRIVRGDEEIIEEVADMHPTKVVSYFNPAAVNSALGIDDINIVEDSAPVVSGAGTAVVQPNLLDPDSAPAAKRSKTEVYVVEVGDTLSGIARKFSVSINTILWENNMSPRQLIRPGDNLTVLPESGLSHTVKSGDTLSAIAKKYSVTSDEIISSNKLASADDLRVGEKLIVPGGEKQVVPKPAATRSIASVRITPGTSSNPPPGRTTGSGRMVWPTEWHTITQYFNWRHSGLDVDGHYNTAIYAADGGVVTHSGWGRTRGGYGYYIDIDHGGGVMTRYAHNSKHFVSKGDRVVRGQTIAMVGTTGRSTGTHLHFEVRVNNRVQNPLHWIR